MYKLAFFNPFAISSLKIIPDAIIFFFSIKNFSDAIIFFPVPQEQLVPQMAPETNPSQVIKDDGVVPVLQITEEDPTIMPVIEDDVPGIINLSLTQAEIDVLAGVDVHPIEENEVALTVLCNLMSEEYVAQSIANLQLPKPQKLHVRKPKKPGCLSGVEALKMFTEEADEKERKECEKEEKKQE